MFLNFCAYYALTRAHFRHIFLAFLVRFIFLEFYFLWSFKADTVCGHSF